MTPYIVGRRFLAVDPLQGVDHFPGATTISNQRSLPTANLRTEGSGNCRHDGQRRGNPGMDGEHQKSRLITMTQAHAILEGDLLSILPTMPDNHFDAVLCDPPYHLTQNSRGGSGESGKGFMGQTWDGGNIAFRPETWEAVMRVMKPGAYLMAFGGSRTFHRLAVAMEDAGFILVDTLMWCYGSGFPKSTNVAARIDKIKGGSGQRIGPARNNTYDGAQRDPSRHSNPADQSHTGEWGLHSTPHGLPTIALETPEGQWWDGYGTALKPAYEPILLCRKPGEKAYAANALKWGCGALNIDGCRIQGEPPHHNYGRTSGGGALADKSKTLFNTPDSGRWPANVMLDEAAAEILDVQSGIRKSGANQGGVSRFFYVGKVSTKERQAGVGSDNLQFKKGATLRQIENAKRQGNTHPTLKPIDLNRHLSTLLLPPNTGGSRKILVPFSGAGSEMIGALTAGWDEVTGIEQSPEYARIARRRIAWWLGEHLMDHVTRAKSPTETKFQ